MAAGGTYLMTLIPWFLIFTAAMNIFFMKDSVILQLEDTGLLIQAHPGILGKDV